jgi:hypothetical protein
MDFFSSLIPVAHAAIAGVGNIAVKSQAPAASSGGFMDFLSQIFW